MSARMVTGVRRCDRITPIVEDLHWLTDSQRVVFKTALMVWKCIHFSAPAYLSDLCILATATSGQYRTCAPHPVELYWLRAKFRQRRQRTDHLEQSAVFTTRTMQSCHTERLH